MVCGWLPLEIGTYSETNSDVIDNKHVPNKTFICKAGQHKQGENVGWYYYLI